MAKKKSSFCLAAALVELSCRATGFDGESPCNRAGLRLASGAVLPTYDWVAHAAPEPAR